MNEESFSKWVILPVFPVIFCCKKRKDNGQTDRKLHRCCSDRITVCSDVLFDRTHHHTYCWDESQILRGLLEQKSFRQLRKHRATRAASWAAKCCYDGSEVAWITLTSHPFAYCEVINLWSKIKTIPRMFFADFQKQKALTISKHNLNSLNLETIS